MIEFRVFGTPMPQGSKTAFVRGGKAFLTDGRNAKSRQSHALWRQAVATAARDWQADNGVPLIEGPVIVEIEFYMDRPKSKPKWKIWPDVAPDIDKLERAVLDSLTGVMIKNDAQVCEVHKRKIYALRQPPGATIKIDILQEGPQRSIELREMNELEQRSRWAESVPDLD